MQVHRPGLFFALPVTQSPRFAQLRPEWWASTNTSACAHAWLKLAVMGWGGARSLTCTHHLSLARGSSGEAVFMTSDFCQLLMLKRAELAMNSSKLNAFLCSTSVSGCRFGPKLLQCYTTWHLAPRMPTWAFDWWLIFYQFMSEFFFFLLCLLKTDLFSIP